MSKAKKQKETPAQRAQAEHAMALLQDYKQRWLPVQQRLAQTIEENAAPDSAARKLARGKASTDSEMAFAKAEQGLEKSLSNSGVGPGSSRANLAITGLGDDLSTSKGMGAVMTDQALDDAYTQGLGALAAIGRGERAQVSNSLSTQATNSAAQAQNDAEMAFAERQGNAQLFGQIGGLGLQQGLKSFGSSPAPQGLTVDPNGYGMNPNNIAGMPRGGA